MTPRLGFAYVPSLPPERLGEVAAACDRYLDELWVWEDCFQQSGLACAAAALAGTERVTVGLGLMPAPLRTVALTAMEIATLHRLFPGRFVPGVGHGVQDWMGQAGVRARSPMTLLEEYATALRRLLDGEKVTVAGRYVNLDEVQLEWPPEPGTPLALGGAGPKSLALAGRLGDSVLLATALSESELARAREIASAQWRQRDCAGQTMPLVHTLIVATGAGAHERAAKEVVEIWQAPDSAGRYAAGSAAEIAETVTRCADLGATTVVLQPTADDPDVPGLIRFLGEQVRPLLT